MSFTGQPPSVRRGPGSGPIVTPGSLDFCLIRYSNEPKGCGAKAQLWLDYTFRGWAPVAICLRHDHHLSPQIPRISRAEAEILAVMVT